MRSEAEGRWLRARVDEQSALASTEVDESAACHNILRVSNLRFNDHEAGAVLRKQFVDLWLTKQRRGSQNGMDSVLQKRLRNAGSIDTIRVSLCRLV